MTKKRKTKTDYKAGLPHMTAAAILRLKPCDDSLVRLYKRRYFGERDYVTALDLVKVIKKVRKSRAISRQSAVDSLRWLLFRSLPKGFLGYRRGIDVAADYWFYTCIDRDWETARDLRTF